MKYTRVEHRVKAWLLTTPVAVLATDAAGRKNIYLAMPKGSPKPVVLLSLTGGGPHSLATYPRQHSRISFDVIAESRDTAADIAYALCDQLEALGAEGDNDNGLCSASVQLVRWQPDPNSDTPRYIVDALITTVE